MLPDATLLQRYAAARDAEAFGELVHRHAGLVFGVCRRICGNAADAEEVAQDCFLQLARHADRIRTSLPAWLHTVAVHAAVRASQVRKARRHEAIGAEVAAAPDADGAAWRELIPHIDAALGRLPAEQREALVLRFLEDRPQEEIAQLMGLSQPTVSRRLAEGVAALRKALGPLSAEALPALVVVPPASLVADLGRMGMAGVGAPAHTVAAGAHAWAGTATLKALVAAVLIAATAFAYSPWSLATPGPHRSAPPAAPPLAAPAPGPCVLAAGWQLQDAAKVAQTGAQLSQAAFAATGWYAATVPGTVLTTLVDNHVYPEPLYGENNRPERIPESLARTDWWYRTVATVPAAYAGKRVWLNFDGINYAAEVWVNGQSVGTITGAFIRGLFDVSALVEPGRPAAIAVRIAPQPHPGVPAEHTLGAGNGPIGGVSRIDGPTFVCAIGWDWLPGIRDRETGIWQKVFLSASGPVTLRDPQVTTALPMPRTDSAAVTVRATLRNVTGQAQKGVLSGGFGDVAFATPVELAAGESRVVTVDPQAFPQMTVANPRLWWPNGFGAPDLYDLHLAFAIDGKTSDAQQLSFGIRDIRTDVPGSDALGLTVNGVRVFCKGGNWGMDEALKRAPRARLEAQVRMHQLANYTMIRDWGGQSTNDDLYDLCDRYGILLWDEFFLFNAKGDPLDAALWLGNVRDKVLRVRNHASLAVWCGCNEADPPKPLDDALRGVLAELDPGRCYHPNSGNGRGVNSGGPYDWQTPADYFAFAQKKDFNRRETFKTEIGAISVPTLESIQGMMPEQDWSTINDDWAEHDFTAGGGRKYPATMAARYGKIANLADFARKGQMMNSEGYRAMYEGRQAQMFNPVQGVLTWMSHPAQPSFVWQIYHYDLEPNAAFFAVRKACEPVHLQLSEVGGGTLQLVNNLPALLSQARARIIVYNLDGSEAGRHDTEVTAAASATTSLGPVAWPAALTPVHFVKLELTDAAGTVRSENLIWRAAAPKPDDLTALATLPVATLAATAVRHDVGGKLLIDVTLRNPGPQVALMAHLQLRRGTANVRVLPAYYSDNYCSLAAREEKTVTIEAALADLRGEKPLVLVDGWNVAVAAASTAAVDVALNAKAQVGAWPQTGLPFAEPKVEPQDEVRANVGGFTRDGFRGDPGWPGVPGWTQEPIDTTGVAMAAPEAIYQTVRWAECSYPFALKGAPGQTYAVRLHFAELGERMPGKRVFDVAINGRTVIAGLDVFAEAGGRDKALVKQFTGVAPDGDGRITIGILKGKAGTPELSGIEILKEPVPASK